MGVNVYIIKADGDYCGGMAIVAAKDEAWAKTLASQIDTFPWRIKYHLPESVSLLPVRYDGEERVLDHYEMGE